MDYLISCSICEEKLLQGILGSSTEFKNFYETERSKIKSPLIWLQNDKLRQEDQISQGRLANLGELSTGYVAITVHNNPAELSDATTVAHELAHAIIREEGFPFIGPYPECRDSSVINLAFSLNNMIHDPLVIIKLLKSGFVLREEYENECLDAIRKNNIGNKYSGINSIVFTLFYVQQLLENELLFSDSENHCTKLIEKIEELYPANIAKGKQIFEFIRSNGFNSPDKVRQIYEKIFDIYPGIRDLTVIC